MTLSMDNRAPPPSPRGVLGVGSEMERPSSKSAPVGLSESMRAKRVRRKTNPALDRLRYEVRTGRRRTSMMPSLQGGRGRISQTSAASFLRTGGAVSPNPRPTGRRTQKQFGHREYVPELPVGRPKVIGKVAPMPEVSTGAMPEVAAAACTTRNFLRLGSCSPTPLGEIPPPACSQAPNLRRSPTIRVPRGANRGQGSPPCFWEGIYRIIR